MCIWSNMKTTDTLIGRLEYQTLEGGISRKVSAVSARWNNLVLNFKNFCIIFILKS